MTENRPSRPHEKRSATRLAALQALYQLEITGSGSEDVIREFVDHRFKLAPEQHDEAFFSDVVQGVLDRQLEIDRGIAECLASGWTLARIDSTLRALLRAAAYELLARRDVPARVVIDEYVELARDFFEGEEPGFVNAVLDRVAHKARSEEFGGPPPAF